MLDYETGHAPGEQEALVGKDMVDRALPYITYAILSQIHELVECSQLYTLENKELGDWSEKKMCQVETGMLQLVFPQVSLKVMEVLGVTRLQISTSQMTEVEEYRYFVI